MMRKSLLLIIPLLLSAREPSAFDAGNLDLEQPYGLTPSERVIVENRDNVRELNTRVENLTLTVNSLNRKVDDFERKLEGVLSVFDGANRGTHDRMISMQERVDVLITQNQELQQKLQDVESTQKENQERFANAVTELGEIINKINRDYVDRERFRKLENAFFELEKTATTATTARAQNFGDDNWQIYVDMQNHFVKQEYDEVDARAKYLISKNFRRAAANYFLGRANFERKRYEDAIYYFKESWSIYDGSEFMPLLLLQSGISLEKLGKKGEANTFYQSLIDSYPQSDEAKEAKKRI